MTQLEFDVTKTTLCDSPPTHFKHATHSTNAAAALPLSHLGNPNEI